MCNEGRVILTQNAQKPVCRPGSSRTRWGGAHGVSSAAGLLAGCGGYPGRAEAKEEGKGSRSGTADKRKR